MIIPVSWNVKQVLTPTLDINGTTNNVTFVTYATEEDAEGFYDEL